MVWSIGELKLTSLSSLKVGTRLALGFAVLLVAILFVGGISWLRLSQLEAVVNRMSTEDAEKARLTLDMQIRTLDNAGKAGRVLMAGDDVAAIEKLRAEIAANSEKNQVDIDRLTQLVRRKEAKDLLAEAAEARLKYNDSRNRVTELARSPKTRDEAMKTFRTETADL